ncbi:MAG: hypothetical protein KGZ31_05580 [Sulfuritalea sp.]|nr:hypothetical protein [Sulfuritalea sp.]
MDRIIHLLIAAPLAALAISFGALATENSRPPAGEAKRQDTQSVMKKRVLDHIDAKIRILQTAKACVRAASDMKAMAVCHEQERKQTKELRKQASLDTEEQRVLTSERREPQRPSAAR